MGEVEVLGVGLWSVGVWGCEGVGIEGVGCGVVQDIGC